MKDIYIHAASSITKQDTFSKTGFSAELILGKKPQTELLEPVYKEYIQASLLRRTPKINKMALACMEDCLLQSPTDEIDAIVVGSGLGCLKDTEKFLHVMMTASEGLMLPPTSFIQSGHNAISGQIALIKKNNNYNMTHVQLGLSFEHALMDAILCIREGKKNVLLGAVDENIDVLTTLALQFGLESEIISEISEGGSFFLLKNEVSDHNIRVADITIASGDWQPKLEAILKKNGLNLNDIDMVFVGRNLSKSEPLKLDIPQFEYTKSCGRYFSSSAFGFHLAADYLTESSKAKNVVIINFADRNQIGLTLLCRD